jgi:hypothetical protein
MSEATSLSALADQLTAEGYDAHELHDLHEELQALERPPGLITRMTKRAKETASRHWSNFVGELHESREAASLLLGRLVGGELSAEERDKVRSQLVDLVKVFPAGLIAAANSAFPIPGTGMFTPWILARLGLMPSRWREAHLLEQLRSHRAKLEQAGRIDAAAQLADLQRRIEAEADARASVGDQAHLLTHWDRNRNGRWDTDEITAYLVELERLRGLHERFAARKAWYIEDQGEIFGALRLTELSTDPELVDHLRDDSLLVCFDGKSGLVALPDLLGRTPRFD